MNELICIDKQHVFSVQQHQHEHWELIYFVSGSGTFLCDELEQPCRAGDILLVPPNTYHTFVSADGMELYCMYISAVSLFFRTPLLLADDDNQSIHHLFADACYLAHQEQDHGTLLNFYVQLICQHVINRRLASPQRRMVEEISQSILQNYANPNYELDTQLRSAPYCYDYLCRLFRQEMHTTPHKYLADLRLQTAADILSKSSRSITEVAHLCGHLDPLYFSRMFKKKYGCSPREYAKRARQK